MIPVRVALFHVHKKAFQLGIRLELCPIDKRARIYEIRDIWSTPVNGNAISAHAIEGLFSDPSWRMTHVLIAQAKTIIAIHIPFVLYFAAIRRIDRLTAFRIAPAGPIEIGLVRLVDFKVPDGFPPGGIKLVGVC